MTVPQTAIDLIKSREGFKQKPYTDTVNKWTVGWGHLMLPSEIAQYGTTKPIAMDVLERFFDYDVHAAYDSAKKQAQVLQVTDPHFIDVLTSVNFQMGAAWFLPESKGGKGFVHTWALLKAHKWEEAASELEHSSWYHQTPTRVKDFQQALRSLVKQ